MDEENKTSPWLWGVSAIAAIGGVASIIGATVSTLYKNREKNRYVEYTMIMGEDGDLEVYTSSDDTVTILNDEQDL